MIWRREQHEWILRLGVLALYLLLRVTTFPTWELTGDDGITLTLAQQASQHFFWTSTTSSVGVPHLPFCYYLLAIPWAIAGSIQFMQWAITLSQLAAHWWLIGAVKKIYSAPVAYAASLLAFFSPAYFSFVGQKFWQPSLLPLLSALLLLCLLRYVRERQAGLLVLGAWLVVLAVSCLQSCIFFLPVLGAAAFLFPPKDRLGIPGRVALLLLTALLFPLLLWIARTHPISLLAACGLIAGIKFGRIPLSGPRQNWRTYAGAALALAIAARIFTFSQDWNPLAGLGAMLCALTPYVRVHWGMDSVASWWMYLPEGIPLLLFFAMSAWRWRSLSDEKKVFVLFLFLPLLALVFSPPHGFFYPHWTLFLLPWIWVGVAAGLGSAAEIIRPHLVGWAAGTLLFGALLGLQLARTLPAQKFLRESGGIGKHGPNLAKRLELFKKISVEADPQITFLVYPYEWPTIYYYEGWRFLARNVDRFGGPAATGPRKYYYIYQETGSKWGPTLLEVARTAPGVVEERLGQVILFITPQPIANAGLSLR